MHLKSDSCQAFDMANRALPSDGPQLSHSNARVTLILDAGSRAVQIALRDRSGLWHLRTTPAEAGVEGMFPELSSLFDETNLRPTEDINNAIFCGGPGSLLGLRTVSMVLATWSRLRHAPMSLFRYHALELALACLRLEHGSKLPMRFHIVSAWKRETWQTLSVTDGTVARPALRETEEISALTDPCFLLEQRKQWASVPIPTKTVDYNLRPFTLPYAFPEDQLELLDSPKLLTPGSNDYQKWNARRHPSP